MSTLSVSNITGLTSLTVDDLNVDSNTFYVDSTNNRVGIGTGSPTTTLTVNGSILLDDGNADGPQIVLASSGYTSWNIDNFDGKLRFYNGVTERAAFDSSGNLGIGNTAPTHKLRVEGTASVLGAATFSNTVTVTGNATFSNTVTVTGSLTFSGVTAGNNATGNRYVSTSDPSGGNDGDIWLKV